MDDGHRRELGHFHRTHGRFSPGKWPILRTRVEITGGDIRPHVVDALQYLVGRIKNECVTEKELFDLKP